MGSTIDRRLAVALLLLASACLHESKPRRYFSVAHRSWDWCLQGEPSPYEDRADEFVVRAPGCSAALFSLQVGAPGQHLLPPQAVALAEPQLGWEQEYRWREPDGALCRALSEPTRDGKRSVIVSYCHSDGSMRQLADDAIDELTIH